MKAVFPCNGSVVLTKTDIETLQAFYNTKLMTSKVYDIYNSSDFMIQVGNFNYIPTKFTIVLDNTKLLDIDKLRNILGIAENPRNSSISSNNSQNKYEDTIKDETILSHPFFQTLNPVD